MYCNYHKTDDGTQKWFSISIDNDETGIEALTIVKNTVMRSLAEAINLDQFEKARELLRFAEDITTALEKAQETEEETNAAD